MSLLSSVAGNSDKYFSTQLNKNKIETNPDEKTNSGEINELTYFPTSVNYSTNLREDNGIKIDNFGSIPTLLLALLKALDRHFKNSQNYLYGGILRTFFNNNISPDGDIRTSLSREELQKFFYSKEAFVGWKVLVVIPSQNLASKLIVEFKKGQNIYQVDCHCGENDIIQIGNPNFGKCANFLANAFVGRFIENNFYIWNCAAFFELGINSVLVRQNEIVKQCLEEIPIPIGKNLETLIEKDSTNIFVFLLLISEKSENEEINQKRTQDALRFLTTIGTEKIEFLLRNSLSSFRYSKFHMMNRIYRAFSCGAALVNFELLKRAGILKIILKIFKEKVPMDGGVVNSEEELETLLNYKISENIENLDKAYKISGIQSDRSMIYSLFIQISFKIIEFDKINEVLRSFFDFDDRNNLLIEKIKNRIFPLNELYSSLIPKEEYTLLNAIFSSLFQIKYYYYMFSGIFLQINFDENSKLYHSLFLFFTAVQKEEINNSKYNFVNAIISHFEEMECKTDIQCHLELILDCTKKLNKLYSGSRELEKARKLFANSIDVLKNECDSLNKYIENFISFLKKYLNDDFLISERILAICSLRKIFDLLLGNDKNTMLSRKNIGYFISDNIDFILSDFEKRYYFCFLDLKKKGVNEKNKESITILYQDIVAFAKLFPVLLKIDLCDEGSDIIWSNYESRLYRMHEEFVKKGGSFKPLVSKFYDKSFLYFYNDKKIRFIGNATSELVENSMVEDSLIDYLMFKFQIISDKTYSYAKSVMYEFKKISDIVDAVRKINIFLAFLVAKFESTDLEVNVLEILKINKKLQRYNLKNKIYNIDNIINTLEELRFLINYIIDFKFKENLVTLIKKDFLDLEKCILSLFSRFQKHHNFIVRQNNSEIISIFSKDIKELNVKIANFIHSYLPFSEGENRMKLENVIIMSNNIYCFYLSNLEKTEKNKDMLLIANEFQDEAEKSDAIYQKLMNEEEVKLEKEKADAEAQLSKKINKIRCEKLDYTEEKIIDAIDFIGVNESFYKIHENSDSGTEKISDSELNYQNICNGIKNWSIVKNPIDLIINAIDKLNILIKEIIPDLADKTKFKILFSLDKEFFINIYISGKCYQEIASCYLLLSDLEKPCYEKYLNPVTRKTKWKLAIHSHLKNAAAYAQLAQNFFEKYLQDFVDLLKESQIKDVSLLSYIIEINLSTALDKLATMEKSVLEQLQSNKKCLQFFDDKLKKSRVSPLTEERRIWRLSPQGEARIKKDKLEHKQLIASTRELNSLVSGTKKTKISLLVCHKSFLLLNEAREETEHYKKNLGQFSNLVKTALNLLQKQPTLLIE